MAHPTEMFSMHCFQVEWRRLDFGGGEKLKNWRKPQELGQNQEQAGHTYDIYDIMDQGPEPRLYWWKLSTLTSGPLIPALP